MKAFQLHFMFMCVFFLNFDTNIKCFTTYTCRFHITFHITLFDY